MRWVRQGNFTLIARINQIGPRCRCSKAKLRDAVVVVDDAEAGEHEAVADILAGLGHHKNAASSYLLAAKAYDTSGDQGKMLQMNRAAAEAYRAEAVKWVARGDYQEAATNYYEAAKAYDSISQHRSAFFTFRKAHSCYLVCRNYAMASEVEKAIEQYQILP